MLHGTVNILRAFVNLLARLIKCPRRVLHIGHSNDNEILITVRFDHRFINLARAVFSISHNTLEVLRRCREVVARVVNLSCATLVRFSLASTWEIRPSGGRVEKSTRHLWRETLTIASPETVERTFL